MFKFLIGGRNNSQKILNAINLYNKILELPKNKEFKIINTKGFIIIYESDDKTVMEGKNNE